jgi:CHASE2 domain-containing sensor protein
MRIIWICGISLISLGCAIKYKANEPLYDTHPIIIISIDQLDRKGLARLFQRLSECSPRAVGLMSLIDEPDSTDIEISEYIGKLGNVVLATLVNGDSVFRSNSLISRNAAGEGFVQFALKNGKAVGHWMLHEQNESVTWSFPLEVLAKYNIDKADELLELSDVDVVYRIPITSQRETFDIVHNLEAIDCSSLSGKIVLIGYTEFDSDKYLVELDGESVEMNITIAMANTILFLLESKELEEIQP